ncbi:ABC transporter substrate-binding protein [Kouleothrix sp.]|uniref:ABC transporter substrate-binding protein n=1 Tax=Kouleothrix sp. TaxID=2779161 RepID=UPI00391947A3
MARPFRFTHALALLLVGLVLLAACGGAAPAAAPTSAPAAEPTAAPAAAPTAAAEPTAAPAAAAATAAPAAAEVSREDTLIFAGDLTDQISMDPAVAYEFGGIQVVGNIYQTLVTFTPDSADIKPWLAKSWDIKQGADGSTITFKLDEKAKFSSGAPVTAADVVYSWNRVLDLNKSPAFLFSDIAGLKKDSYRAVDPQTFEVKLAPTTSPQVFLSILSFTISAPVEQKVVEANAGSDFGSTWLNDHSAGSGPYVLTSWERNTQNVLDLNPNYSGTPPAFKRVIMRNIPEQANLQSAIETGDADIAQDLGTEQVKALEGNADVTLVKASLTQLVYLGLNAKSPPLDKPEVREAIRYAINYDELNTLLGGSGKIVQEIIPDGFLGHTGNNPFKQDIAKAKDLLAKAGVKPGTEIEVLVPTGPAPGGLENSTLAAKLQADIEQIGLKLNLKQIQTSELLNTYRAQKGQIVLISWGPDFPDPDANATPFTNYEAKSIGWRNGWEAPDVAKLAKDASLAPDAAKRTELYKQLVDRVQHEGPYAVLYQPVRTYGVRKNIKGFAFGPISTPNVFFWTISKS